MPQPPSYSSQQQLQMPQPPGYSSQQQQMQPNGLLGPPQPQQDLAWGGGAPVTERAAAISAEAGRLQQQYAQLQQQMAALQQEQQQVQQQVQAEAQQQHMHSGAGLYGSVAVAGSGLGGVGNGGMPGGGGVDWGGGGGGGVDWGGGGGGGVDWGGGGGGGGGSGGGGGGGSGGGGSGGSGGGGSIGSRQHADFSTSMAALEPPARPHLLRTVECRHWQKGNCHRGEACNFAHSQRMPGGNAVPTAAQGRSGHYGGGHTMGYGPALMGPIGAPLMSHLPTLPGHALASTPVPFVPRRRDGPAPAINPNPTIVGGKRKYDDNPTGAGMLGMGRVRIYTTARALSTCHAYTVRVPRVDAKRACTCTCTCARTRTGVPPLGARTMRPGSRMWYAAPPVAACL